MDAQSRKLSRTSIIVPKRVRRFTEGDDQETFIGQGPLCWAL
ncbi:MAG: hypothetical protein U9R48_10485 [Chloroflexota bacterium]|nr:hypothetical protein [Chloroflexota bacterium]